MKSKSVCQSVLESLLTDGTENLSDEISSHLADCDKCRSEYEKLEKTRKLISASAPAVPDLRRSVIEKINSENITMNKKISHRRRHIPLGTIAAAAAILAVYVSVYGTKLPNMVFKEADKADESAELSENITAAPDILMKSAAPANFGAGDASDDALFDKGSDIYYFEASDESRVTADGEENQVNSLGKNSLQANSAGGSGASANQIDNFSKSENIYNYSNGSESDSDSGNGDIYRSESGYITKGRDVLMSYPTMNVLGFISGCSPDEFSDGCDKNMNEAESSGGENGMAFSGGSDTAKQSDGQNYEELDGEKIFEIMSQSYPDRISYEVFENVGSEVYKEFVLSLADFEIEYTETGLVRYSQSVSLR